MPSVLASYRQKAQTGKYLIVIGTPNPAAAYTISRTKIPSTVVVADVGSSEAMVDSDGVAGTVAGATFAAGDLLLDLGREAVIYDGAFSITGVTSPYYKRAIYREVALAATPAGNGGAPGQGAVTYWIKVWSASGADVNVARV